MVFKIRELKKSIGFQVLDTGIKFFTRVSKAIRFIFKDIFSHIYNRLMIKLNDK